MSKLSPRSQVLRWIAWAALLAAAAACQTPPRVKVPEPPPLSAEVPVPVDASFDWHRLLIAPFGSVLKDVPAELHEVLLFRDQDPGKDPGKDPGAAPPEDGECYAADTPPPQFVEHTPDEYMLCFKQDRLSRIQAMVRLPHSNAAAVFAAACTGWLKNAMPAATTASADACEGRDGAVHFSAHFEHEPDTVLSITLDSAVDP